MTLTRWNPFREMDDLMDQYTRNMRRMPATREQVTSADWSPYVDVIEDDKEYLIKVELPEVAREDVNVQVHEGVLTISGERKLERDDKKRHRIERFYGRFMRSFTLPEDVAADGIEATHKDGMLYLHLKKQVKVEPKAINIKVS
ncbi:MAG: Hsp20/alpha crystallin family protein [Gammaproteobacteria bacterium]|nr:Hsp20/alpha crystallin family protein [Gammaproteobacteria bacterium]